LAFFRFHLPQSQNSTVITRTHLKNRFDLAFSSIRALAEALEVAPTGGCKGNSSNDG